MCAADATLNQPSPDRSKRFALGRLTWLAPAMLLGSCVNAPVKPTAEQAVIHPIERPGPVSAAAPSGPGWCSLPLAQLDTDTQVWDRLRAGFVLWDISHPRVDLQRERLLRNPAALQGMLKQAGPWLQHIAAKVAERRLPMELALLPAVESGFRPYAYSRSGAAGLWQFMPATGRMQGLTQDWWFDGRRDVVSGTQAALDYLEALNRQMDGDWLHALASYNAGAGTLRKAIRKNRKKAKSTAYWDLDLPGETDAYVPRLLALSAIIADPLRYGVELPDLPDRPAFMVMDTGSQLDLGVAAELAGLPVKELAELNAGLNRLATPPSGPHRLLIPTSHAARFEASLAQLPEEARLQRDRYTVKAGDSLSVIASRHGITTAALKSANGLRSNHIRIGQDLLVPRYESALALAPVRTSLPRSKVRYRVRQGDSLYEIAQKFRVSVGQLRRWNRLSGSLLRPGQQLTLFVDPARQTL
jgi:membrane-bound lytic murein transglycosylase D